MIAKQTIRQGGYSLFLPLDSIEFFFITFIKGFQEKPNPISKILQTISTRLFAAALTVLRTSKSHAPGEIQIESETVDAEY
ncbi:hypothetical protein RRG08_061350 [Elysia crispata]|uniref:Uncharacterized protein n=1 Tax=Elysia crispata TaxID=231223 RepID=A0AAE1AF61_9GAST|nr:hypothetical protein RRG08_061350 [Elysia crispata]